MSVGLGMGMALEHAKSHLIHKCDLLSMKHPPRFPPNPPSPLSAKKIIRLGFRLIRLPLGG